MKAVAYCRVSTNKDEQIQSLQNQKDFFSDYITKKGDELVRIYSDEGLSGTKLKNRKQLNQLIADAKKGQFEKLYCKDISRLCRNTLDFLNISQDLKRCGVELHFINLGNGRDMDEFTLTLLASLAEQESLKISERVKFGKQSSKEKGIVPNFVFGYDRIDKFTLEPNKIEAPTVKQIFDLYVNDGYGMAKIAEHLFVNGIKTKKNEQKNWSQKVVGDILRNQIYIGKIINGKQYKPSFKEDARKPVAEENWYVREYPEIRLISDETFNKAQELMKQKAEIFNQGTRSNTKHLFSNLLKCNDCGLSFRRFSRQYCENGKIYSWWVCSKKAAYGENSCLNKTRIDEDWLKEGISNLLKYIIQDKESFFKIIETECNKQIKEYIKANICDDDMLRESLADLNSQRERIKEMVKRNMIDMDEAEREIAPINTQIAKINLTLDESNKTKEITDSVKDSIKKLIDNFNSINIDTELNNITLKSIIKFIKIKSKDEIYVYFNVSDNVKELSFPLEISSTFCYYCT